MGGPISRTLHPGDEADLKAFLSGQLESSMFLLGNARTAGLGDHSGPLQGTYAAVFEEGAITAVAAHFWNGNLVLQAPRHTAYLARQVVRASGRPLQGVLGPSEQVEVVKLALQPSALRLDEIEKLYSLSLDVLLLPDLLTSGRGRARLAEPRDADLFTRWRVAYSLETLNETESPELREHCRSSERYIREQRLWVLEVAGIPVACSAFNAATEEAVQVGSVWTPPEQRSQGYGSSVVAASLLDTRT